MQDPRILGIELTSDTNSLAFLNVYLPVDNSRNIDDFLYYTSKVADFIDGQASPYVAAFGDFNANISPNAKSAFGQHLLQLCQDNNLFIADQRLCPSSTFTFYSEAHGSVSWL